MAETPATPAPATDALAGTGLGEGGALNGQPTASYQDIMARIVQARSEGTCSQFGLAEGCTTGQIIGGYIGQNERNWQAQRQELCQEILGGTDQKTVVQRAGLHEDTDLKCAAPQSPEQAKTAEPPAPAHPSTVGMTP